MIPAARKPARAARTRLLAAVLCAAASLAGVPATAQQNFAAWYAALDSETPIGRKFAADRATHIDRVESEGAQFVVVDIRSRVEALRGTGSRADDANIAKFLRLTGQLLATLADRERGIAEALAIRPSRSETGAAVTAIARAGAKAEAQGPANQRGNPFSLMGESQVLMGFFISENDPSGNEIRIEESDTSAISRRLWTYGLLLEASVNFARLPIIDATTDAIAGAQQRWADFMDKVAGDQFFWETLFNGGVATFAPSLEGTLMTPPTIQLRVVHPTPMVAYSSQGGSAVKPRLAAEVLGYRKYARETFEPEHGISIVTLLPGDRDESFGWGLLLTLTRASFGFVWQDDGQYDDVFTVIFGFDLAKSLNNQQSGLKDRATGQLTAISDEVVNRQDQIASCIANRPNAIETCMTP